MLEALSAVRLAPDRTGSIPPAVNWTSWLAELKLLPCKVTVVLRRESLRVPEAMLVALRAVKLEPLRAGKKPVAANWTSWSAPLKVLPCKVVVAGMPAAAAPVPVQPLAVQTKLLSMVRPALLRELLPPEALKVPLAVRLPVNWTMPVVGSAIS